LRNIYSFILYLLAPFVVLRLILRSKGSPAYRRRWSERFGYISQVKYESTIWLHAVSVGEVQAALPLLQSLREKYPGKPVVVTTMTPTGSERVREILGENVIHVYVPYDLPGAVQRFLNRTRPCLTIIMETELWPNLFYFCRRQKIPIIVANARLSERSARGYRRFHRLTRQTLQLVSAFAVQADADASRLIELGADITSVHVTGNIKFDIKIPASLYEQAQALRREWGQYRPVWIAASTHEGEDEIVLEAFAKVRQEVSQVLLVLVPRHPERFANVAALCGTQGYKVMMRSERQLCDSTIDIVIGDTMGELRLFYGASDVAFVGGSLVPTGGHNVLEPAAMRLPVIFGPHMFNFDEISRLFLQADAAIKVNDAQGLARAVTVFLTNTQQRLETGEKAYEVIEKNRGALEKMLVIIDRFYCQASEVRI